MHPARIAAALLVLAPLLASTGAGADQLLGTRFELEERAHDVEVRVDRGFASLVVRRTVANSGPRSDQAVLRVDMPPGAVATRLRTTGTDAKGRPVWFEGELMDAEHAAAEYRELTGFGESVPMDPALLYWRGQGRLGLQVFPVPPEGTKTVEYTLLVPAHYVDGKYVLDLQQLGTPERAAVLHVKAEHGEDRVRVNGVPIARGAPVETSREITIELSPERAPRLSGSLAVVPLGPLRVFVHERAAAAPRLGEVPDHAAVAVVLDVSRSMADDVASEVAAARAYVSRFDDAAVTIVTFDRRVSLPFGTGLSVADAMARLQTYEPKLGNGSQLDDALRRADEVLSRSPLSTRRALVLTDLRTREALSPERFAALGLKSGAIVHLSTVASGTSSLERDDGSPWAALPRRTGGVFWHATAAERDPTARAVFEEWARPKRIDNLRAVGFSESLTVSDSLEEGHDLEYLGIVPAAPGAITVDGELWSSPVHIKAVSSPEEERRWSALAFGSSVFYDLVDEEQRTLAMKGRAVSPVTSYLAIEPGVRPSTEGLDLDEVGIGDGGGGIGHGFGRGLGSSLQSSLPPFDPKRFLEGELGRAWTACGGAGAAEVHFEVTRAEVVDVGDVALSAPSEKVGTCMKEAAWGLDLPERFTEEHEAWTIRVGG